VGVEPGGAVGLQDARRLDSPLQRHARARDVSWISGGEENSKMGQAALRHCSRPHPENQTLESLSTCNPKPPPTLIRIFPSAHPSGYGLSRALPGGSIVEDLQAAPAHFAEIASDLKLYLSHV